MITLLRQIPALPAGRLLVFDFERQAQINNKLGQQTAEFTRQGFVGQARYKF